MTNRMTLSVAGLVTLSMALPAMAQTQPTPSEAQARSGQNREVVVVTAQKREESVQDTAVAITAITADTREELGIESITDLTNITPGLSFTAGNDRISLRGVGRYTNNFGTEPGVANYSDGIYQSFAVTAGRNNIFVDRIEVLRGPQGTLYGRNSVGGAINIISRRPTDSLVREVRFGMGNYDYRTGSFTVSGPLTDSVRGRVTGSYQDREGYFTNVATDEKDGGELGEWFLEGQLEGDVGDRLSWWVKATTADWNKSGPPGGQTNVGINAPYETGFADSNSIMVNPAWAFTGNPTIIDFQQVGDVTSNPSANDLFLMNRNVASYAIFDAYHEYTAETIYEMDTFDIKWLGGYVFYKYRLPADTDATPVTSITYLANALGRPDPAGNPLTIYPEWETNYQESRAFFSNEVNLISTTDSPLQWILGAYAYQESSHQPVSTSLPNEPLADMAFNPLFGMVQNPGRLVTLNENTNVFNAYGLYGQLDYQINEQWKATGGLRYSYDLKSIKEEALLRCYVVCAPLFGGQLFADLTPVIRSGNPPASFVGMQPGVTSATETNRSGVTYDPVTGMAMRRLKDNWDAVTGTLGLEYSPVSETLLFGRYSRGYKNGGFNATSMAPLPRTNEEIVDSFELGWKQEYFPLNLTTNAALFYYDYQDVQIPLTVIPDTGTNYTTLINVPKVETVGFELETNWNPIDNLSLLFTYAYLDAQVKESDTFFDPIEQVGKSLVGNTIPYSSEHKVALNARYTFEFENGSTFTPSLNYFWKDGFTSDIFNNPESFAPAYDQTDLRLIWRDPSQAWTVIGFARNVFDELGYDNLAITRRSTTGEILSSTTPTPPRLYGIEVAVEF